MQLFRASHILPLSDSFHGDLPVAVLSAIPSLSVISLSFKPLTYNTHSAGERGDGEGGGEYKLLCKRYLDLTLCGVR